MIALFLFQSFVSYFPLAPFPAQISVPTHPSRAAPRFLGGSPRGPGGDLHGVCCPAAICEAKSEAERCRSQTQVLQSFGLGAICKGAW